MNLAALAPQWLALLFVVLLFVAAIEDAMRLRISNVTCIAILAAGLLAVVLAGPEVALWQNLAGFVGMLLIGTLFFAAGKMGGGDIKLLAVTIFWFDLQGALWLLLYVLIAGGILAVIMIGFRSWTQSNEATDGVGRIKRGGVIPYGVAIAAGAIFCISRAAGWR